MENFNFLSNNSLLINISDRKQLRCDFFYNKNLRQEPAPIVVLVHGFRASRKWGFFPHLATRLSTEGFHVLTFDFSRNGWVENKNGIHNPEEFRHITNSEFLEELLYLLDFINNNRKLDKIILSDEIWNNEFYLMGHSLGGGISILAARENKNIKKLSLWASIAMFDRYTAHQKRIWKQTGFAEISDPISGNKLRLDVSYLLDIEKNKDNFNLTNIISRLEIPILYIHGALDLGVKTHESEILYNSNSKYSKLLIINKTGHGFGAAHPFIRSNPQLEDAISNTILHYKNK